MFLDIDHRSLPFVEASTLGIKQLPAKRGIYIVSTREGKPLYVGRSKNFFNRWKVHHKKHFAEAVNALIYYLEIPEPTDLVAVENNFINILNPSWNRITPNIPTPNEKGRVRMLATKVTEDVEIMAREMAEEDDCTVSHLINRMIQREHAARRKSRRPE